MATALLGGILLLCPCACTRNKNPLHDKSRDVESVTISFEPNVTDVSWTRGHATDVPQGKGRFQASVFNLVERNRVVLDPFVVLSFRDRARPSAPAIDVMAGQLRLLPSGTYDVTVKVARSSLVRSSGQLKSVAIRSQMFHKAEITVSLRYDRFKFAFMNMARPVDAKVTVEVFRLGDLDNKLARALLTMKGVTEFDLPAGTYDLRFRLFESASIVKTIDQPDFVVRGELGLLNKAVEFNLSVGALVLKAINLGQDVTAKTHVRVYRDSTAALQQKPIYSGSAGEPIWLEQGGYRVWVEYREGDSALMRTHQWLKGVIVRGGYLKEPLSATFAFAFGELAFRVLDGTTNVDDQSRIFVFRSAAPERALEHLSGGATLKLPVGTYDFKVVYLRKDGASGMEHRRVTWKRGVVLLANKKLNIIIQTAPPGAPK